MESGHTELKSDGLEPGPLKDSGMEPGPLSDRGTEPGPLSDSGMEPGPDGEGAPTAHSVSTAVDRDSGRQAKEGEKEEEEEERGGECVDGSLTGPAPPLAPEDGTELRPYHALLGMREVTLRVTCTRGGRKHSFSSQEAAGHFGGGLARYFGWKVQLKQPAMEVLLNISDDMATIGLALTKYKRNISNFGPTTLHSTIAYGILSYAVV